MYCTKCGKEIAAQAQFCPYCGAQTAAPHIPARPAAPPAAPYRRPGAAVPAYQQPRAAVPAQAPAPKKKPVALFIILGAVGFLLLAFLVCAFAFDLFGFRKPNPKQAYSNYLKNEVVEEYGIVNQSRLEREAAGLAAAVVEDIDGDDAEDMVGVVINNNRDYNNIAINSYHYDTKKGAVSQTAEQIALSTSMAGVTNAKTTIYKGTNQSKKPIVLEQFQLINSEQSKGYAYFVSVFLPETDGTLKKAGDIAVRRTLTNDLAQVIVFGNVVPEGMKVYEKSDYEYEGNSVYFAKVGDDVNKTSLYSSDIAALEAFFEQFHLDVHAKSDNLKGFASNLKLGEQTHTAPLLSDAQTVSASGDFSYAHHDYTDMQTLVSSAKEEKKPAQQKQTTEDVSEVLLNSLVSKIQFPNNEYIVSSLLEDGGFNAQTCTEEQMLQIAFASYTYNGLQYIQKPTVSEYTGDVYDQSYAAITQRQMQDRIKELFGPDVSVKDQSFSTYNTHAAYTSFSNMYADTVEYSDGLYSVFLEQGGGGDAPFTDQVYSRSEKVGDEIHIYVKPALIDVSYFSENNNGDFYYHIQKDLRYGFATTTLKTVSSQDYFKVISRYNGNTYFFNNIHMQIPSIYQDIFKQMTEYCYTFKRAEGGYYLSSFSRATKEEHGTLDKQIDTLFEQHASSSFKKAAVTDFDKDGKEEAFAVIGNETDTFSLGFVNASLYFVNESGAKLLETDTYGYLKTNLTAGNYTFFNYERSGGGSGSVSRVFGVRNGVPTDMQVNCMNFQQNSLNGTFVGNDQSFAKGFHEYISYEYSFDAASFRFVKGGRVK
ncbi:MAG: zinc ribbon domain-containing protein [Clostridia bacterium]|nr:zinc ribbon domain-containing protein [Clostridia bacterium]